MGLPLKNGRKKNLYEFWGDKITELINSDLAESGSDTVVNLASQEYFRAVKPALLKGNLFHIHFKEWRNGQYKVISFNAKKARGILARQIIINRITEIEEVKSFDVDGYVFKEELSGKREFLFARG